MAIIVVRPSISGKRTPGLGAGLMAAANTRATASATGRVDRIDTGPPLERFRIVKRTPTVFDSPTDEAWGVIS
jgi:hypothetical protein